MMPDRVSNAEPLTYESGALPIALRGPARRWDVTTVHYVADEWNNRSLCERTEDG